MTKDVYFFIFSSASIQNISRCWLVGLFVGCVTGGQGGGRSTTNLSRTKPNMANDIEPTCTRPDIIMTDSPFADVVASDESS
jgi:hypothetical protein